MAVLTTVLAGYVWYLYRRWDFDDAFIVYRYVANLRAGNGWTFNADEALNASTSVLNPLLTLVASIPLGGIPLAAHVVGVLALAIGLIAVSQSLLEERRWVPAIIIPATGLLLPPLLLSWGLETQLFLGLALLFVALEQQRRSTWLLVGLLALTRPDGALFVVFKVAREIWLHRHIPWRGIQTVAAVTGPWAVYSVLRFGTLIPATFGNKRDQGASGRWGEGLVYLRGLRDALTAVFTGPGIVIAVSAIAALGVLVTLYRRRWSLSVLGLFAFTQQAIYAVMNPPYYHWYGVVFIFAICFYSLLGVDAVVGALRGRVRTGASVAIIGVVAWAFWGNWLPRTEATPGTREVAYQHVVDYVRDRHPSARSISATEAGVVGFYMPLDVRLVDLIGLTSDNPPYYKGEKLDTYFENPPDLALFHHIPPDQVWPFEAPVFQDERFSHHYELEHVFSTPGYTDLTLYRRSSVPSPRSGDDPSLESRRRTTTRPSPSHSHQ